MSNKVPTAELLPRSAEDMHPDKMAERYRLGREKGPAFDGDILVVSGYDDVTAVMKSPDFSNQRTLVPIQELCPEAGMKIGALLPQVPPNTVGGDGELHRRARSAIMAEFPIGLRAVRKEHMMGMIQHYVGEMTNEIAEKSVPIVSLGGVAVQQEVDIMPVVWDLPHKINREVLGFPESKLDAIKQAGVGQIDLVWGKSSPAEQVQSVQGLEDLWEMSLELVKDHRDAQRKGDVPEDFTGRLLRYVFEQNTPVADKPPLTDEEIAGIVMNFAVAGHETTANSLANGLRYMMDHREVWELLKNRPEATDDIVQELLRLCPSIYGWMRYAERDTNIGKVSVPKGTLVLLSLGAANRDPEKFGPDADAFNHERLDKSEIVTFGVPLVKERRADSHYCPGASMARVVMGEAYKALARRFPDLQTVDAAHKFSFGFDVMQYYKMRFNSEGKSS